MTKFDKITTVLSTIDAALAAAHLVIGKHPVLDATLSEVASAGMTQVI